MSETAADVNDQVLQWVTFRLGNETYGINVLEVREVLRVSDITPVPGVPHYVLGIINLRGNVVTVLDTRQRFGLEAKGHDELSRVVIIEINEQVVGLLVDSVAEVVYLRSSEVEPAPNVGSEETAKYIQGVHSRDNDLLILIDVGRLIADEEWTEVA